jgi:putative flippase GtrA
MLYTAVSILGIALYIATPASFLIAVSINYALSRRIVFCKTERTWHKGYALFIVAALLGAMITTAVVTTLVTYAGLYYLVARIIAAGIVGMGNYLFNLYVNFNVAGKH